MTPDQAGGALPDPAQSRAILVGSSRYRTLPPLSSVYNNLGGLAAILRDPDVWGLPAEHCTVIADPQSPARLVKPIQAAAEQAVDTLLVYYAGHGLTNRSGDLHLTHYDSDADAQYSQVPYQWVRDPIRDSPARRRIVILDCCYSGRALNDAMGNEAPYADQAAIDGSFILTATPENRQAMAPANQEYTAFTHELVAVMGEGLENGDALLNLNEIFNELQIRLRGRSLPPPQARDRNNLGAQTSFRNKAFIQGEAPREPRRESRDAAVEAARRQVWTVCVRASASFLRSERLSAHERLYVKRPVDDKVAAVIEDLNPIKLRRIHRIAKPKRGEASGDPMARIAPPQVMVLSDEAGCGKTMLAVQLSRLTEACGAVLRHAGSPVADDLRRVTRELGPDLGLSLLRKARMPIVFAVDGLEQADHVRDQKQIIELFKLVAELNERARRARMLAYPLAVLFTIRDAEWDRWFTVFEGRNVVELRGGISRFTANELDTALKNYSSVYDYQLRGEPPADKLDRLRAPLNLRTLSESFEYQGETEVADALDEPILSLYMRRKTELMVGMLPWLTRDELSTALTALATELVETRTVAIDIAQAAITDVHGPSLSRENGESLLRALIDQGVLAHTPHGVRFRQPGVLEYLMATDGVRKMSESGSVAPLEALTSKVAEASPTSSAVVRSNVEEIVQTRHGDSEQMAAEHYASSPVYTSSRLSFLRFELSAGGRTSEPDLDSIYGSLHSLGPNDAWDAFFVVAAVANRQAATHIVEAFAVAWDTNDGWRADRWKLLYKLRERGLLYRDEVITRVLRSQEPRDWESFFGGLAQESDPESIMARVNRATTQPLHELIGHGQEWRQVRGLLKLLAEGGTYVSGRVW